MKSEITVADVDDLAEGPDISVACGSCVVGKWRWWYWFRRGTGLGRWAWRTRFGRWRQTDYGTGRWRWNNNWCWQPIRFNGAGRWRWDNNWRWQVIQFNGAVRRRCGSLERSNAVDVGDWLGVRETDIVGDATQWLMWVAWLIGFFRTLFNCICLPLGVIRRVCAYDGIKILIFIIESKNIHGRLPDSQRYQFQSGFLIVAQLATETVFLFHVGGPARLWKSSFQSCFAVSAICYWRSSVQAFPASSQRYACFFGLLPTSLCLFS